VLLNSKPVKRDAKVVKLDSNPVKLDSNPVKHGSNPVKHEIKISAITMTMTIGAGRANALGQLLNLSAQVFAPCHE
jgi:flagellar basal body rod protein FlgB